VCGRCHLPEKFDSPAHHFHKAGTAGASCTGCHMPTRNYMVVHARHDHSFRIPRPDLSEPTGAPNVCTGCHGDKTDAWASAAALKWWGDTARQQPHYGEVIHAAREEMPGAGEGLARLVSDPQVAAIRRATAASLIVPGAGSGAFDALVRAATYPDPIVRDGAVAASEGLEPTDRLRLVTPLLRDPVLTVRIEAARALSAVPKDSLGPSDRAAYDAALAEYVATQNVDADRAEAHLNLALLAADRGDLKGAESEYGTALRLSPGLAGTYVNLADLYRMQGRDEDAERVLRRGLKTAGRDPGIHEALGLTLVRLKRMPEALVELERAATLPPQRSRYSYVYGVALDGTGHTDRALEVLRSAHERHPGNRDLLVALAMFSAKSGDRAGAIGYARALTELDPRDTQAAGMLRQLTQNP
jgi:Flp pilus assembly protein TadD